MTPRQQQLLAYIRDRVDATGLSPTFEEMRAALGLASRSSVARMVDVLVDYGYLAKACGGGAGRRRAIRLASRHAGAVADLQSVPTSVLVAEINRRGVGA